GAGDGERNVGGRGSRFDEIIEVVAGVGAAGRPVDGVIGGASRAVRPAARLHIARGHDFLYEVNAGRHDEIKGTVTGSDGRSSQRVRAGIQHAGAQTVLVQGDGDAAQHVVIGGEAVARQVLVIDAADGAALDGERRAGAGGAVVGAAGEGGDHRVGA